MVVLLSCTQNGHEINVRIGSETPLFAVSPDPITSIKVETVSSFNLGLWKSCHEMK